MVYVLVSITAFVAASLTLLSGFGLSTILTPVFALFFTIPVAVAATAVVHLANNIFQIILVGRHANWDIVLRFALPAAVAAVIGAALLGWIASVPSIITYQTGNQAHEITWVKLVIGLLIIGFSLFDLMPSLKKITIDKKYLVYGGLLSGFFGGLSGNQGALRSAFLVKSGIETEVYVGTSSICGFVVDIVRLIVYSITFYTAQFRMINSEVLILVLVAIFFAFMGSFLASRFLKKITINVVQLIVGIMLITVSAGLISGLI